MSLFRAFSTIGCPEFSLDEAIALAGRYGLGGVELRALGGTVELPDYFAAQFGAPAALAEKMRGASVRIVGFDTSLRLVGNTAADREKLLEFLPWAEALGGVRLRVFDGGKTADDGEFPAAVETLRWWQEQRAARGWKSDFMIETHDTLVTTAALQRFLQRAPEGTAILWDTHHTWKKAGENPVETWAAIKAHVCHVHVKDSVSVPSARHPFTYVLPGEGEFPVARLLAQLQEERFAGPVCLEWEKMWHPYLPSLDDALRVAAERAWW